jgi:protein-disulfide isomerase
MPDLKKFDVSPSLAILISGVLIAGAIIFVNLHPAPATVADAAQLPTSVNVPTASASDHIVGSPSAPIVLIEYSDFQCPYCQMVHPTLKRIVSESNGEVAWVMRNFPLTSIHPQAKPAALAAECVAELLGNDAWWKFADTLFANQKSLGESYYAQVAVQLGADPAKFSTCVSSEKYATKLDQQSLEAEQNGGSGTPYTVIVGGGLQVPISGALPYAQFMSVINQIKSRQ